jgi:cellulose synthase/poly-beta-1,6-N-acetylglucosamine synthase-like glycosyltransferase
METLIIIGIVLAVAATIFICVRVLPKKYDGRLDSKFLQFLHDFFNFKTFYIEALTKFIFILLTCLCIFVGFLLMFGKFEYYGYFGMTFTQSTFLYGLGIMLLGPLVLRVTYEFVMMAILLVQNVIDINRKMKAPAATAAAFAPADNEAEE